jgi:hypothetical protein
MSFVILKKINLLVFNIKKLHLTNKLNFLKNFYFLNRYFKINDLLWQEGLLLDFLQKKSSDLWIKKFLIYSSYLFNERFLFDKITRFFINLFIIPNHKFFIFEVSNVSNLLFFNIFFFLLFFFIVISFYLFTVFI